MEDKRTYEYFENYEPAAQPTFEEHLRSGPLPKKNWVKVMIGIDQSLALLHESAHGQGLKMTNWDSDRLKKKVESIEATTQLVGSASDELTDVEASVCQVILATTRAATLLREAALSIVQNPKSQSESFKKLMVKISDWLDEKAARSRDPKEDIIVLIGRELPTSFHYFHRAFMNLEALQGIALFLRFAKGYTKPKTEGAACIPKETLAQIREKVEEMEKAIHDHAKHMKTELEKPGFLDLLDFLLERDVDKQGEVGKAIQGMMDEAEIEEYVGQMRDSWIDGLNGILKVRVGKTQ
ncbi:MAG: hypothetical protein Q9227_003320 [Pyrenula ochraceoflavens]